ncbi:uncharacterized protein LOC116259696 [Nymphaea colorata]|nr:uncharacterized protein LOC116259696 [Nymphaea colorata]
MDATNGEGRRLPPPSLSSSAGGHTLVQGEDNSSSYSSSRKKPPFRLVQDDTKPMLRDPILRSDPIETEEAVLRLPPFPLKALPQHVKP